VRDWRAAREGDAHAAARTSSNTPESLIVGAGTSGALLAGAAIVFISLVGLVSFNVWPSARDSSGAGSVELRAAANQASSRPAESPRGGSGKSASTGRGPTSSPSGDAGGGGGGSGDGGKHHGSKQPSSSTTPVTAASSGSDGGNGNGRGNGNGGGNANGGGSTKVPLSTASKGGGQDEKPSAPGQASRTKSGSERTTRSGTTTDSDRSKGGGTRKGRKTKDTRASGTSNGRGNGHSGK
jgi:hypothetical protein